MYIVSTTQLTQFSLYNLLKKISEFSTIKTILEGRWKNLVRVVALPLTSCLTLGQLLCFMVLNRENFFKME